MNKSVVINIQVNTPTQAVRKMRPVKNRKQHPVDEMMPKSIKKKAASYVRNLWERSPS